MTWAGAAGSVALTLAGFYMTWRRFQGESLRSRDVALWADRAIAVLMTVELCAAPENPVTEGERSKRLTDAYVQASTLVEQGRLFFRNVSDAPLAKIGDTYAGRRPRVLDPLVVAHKIAARLLVGTVGDPALYRVAQEQRRLFVRAVQHEIGRRQSASWEARRAGETSDLDALIAGMMVP